MGRLTAVEFVAVVVTVVLAVTLPLLTYAFAVVTGELVVATQGEICATRTSIDYRTSTIICHGGVCHVEYMYAIGQRPYNETPGENLKR